MQVWFQDEARFGQQGTRTRVWARRGSRPRAARQTEYAWVDLFAAVNPRNDDSVALLAPTVNTFMMNRRGTDRGGIRAIRLLVPTATRSS